MSPLEHVVNAEHNLIKRIWNTLLVVLNCRFELKILYWVLIFTFALIVQRREKTCLWGFSDIVRFKPACSATETS